MLDFFQLTSSLYEISKEFNFDKKNHVCRQVLGKILNIPKRKLDIGAKISNSTKHQDKINLKRI